MIMASKRRSRTVEMRTSYATRRAKSTRHSKKLEDTKLISEQTTKTKNKNVIREIEKPKLYTDKKPQEQLKTLKQKKIHKCAICLKVFKGNNKHLNVEFFNPNT